MKLVYMGKVSPSMKRITHAGLFSFFSTNICISLLILISSYHYHLERLSHIEKESKGYISWKYTHIQKNILYSIPWLNLTLCLLTNYFFRNSLDLAYLQAKPEHVIDETDYAALRAAPRN